MSCGLDGQKYYHKADGGHTDPTTPKNNRNNSFGPVTPFVVVKWVNVLEATWVCRFNLQFNKDEHYM